MPGITTEWRTVTPTFRAAGGSPAVGNGSLEFTYRRVDGELRWIFDFRIGSTTNPGTGLWLFTIADEGEFPSDEDLSVFDAPPVPARVYDASAAVASQMLPGQLVAAWGTAVDLLDLLGIQEITFLVVGSFGSGRLSATNPVTFASGDRIVGGNTVPALNT